MARFPSGLGNPLPERVDDPRAWMARIAVAAEEQPIGTSAPCLNPECTQPVDYLGTGIAPRSCGSTCRSRAATLRRNARQQLDVIEDALAATRRLEGIPRDELHARANMLRWWLARLSPRDEPTT